MGKIKIGLVITALTVAVVLILGGVISAQDNPLQGKIIALDAGHGGEKLGAQYPANCASDGDASDCLVYEKDVNLTVVYTLKNKLEMNGAKVVLTRLCDETITGNKERVDLAVERCKQVDLNEDGQADGKKCDALVSVHHNGATDATYDGTMVIYNENQDLPLAKALLETLVPLTGINEGLAHGGYGMTVYDHLVSALTEAYYITNTTEAGLYLDGTPTKVCTNTDGSDYLVLIGSRVNQEADALSQGLFNYFSAPPKKPGRK